MRHLFGLSPSDFAMEQVGVQLQLVPGAVGTVWDALADGNQITDLTDLNGTAITQVSADDTTAQVGFYGPDGVNWLYADFGVGFRFLLSATDLGDEVDALQDSKADAASPVFTGDVTVPGGQVVPLGWFNVKGNGFDAVGDGVADDTLAIQAAIDAANAAGGGTVYLSAGTYKLTDSVILKSHVKLKGDGITATVLTQTSTTKHGIKGSNLELVGVEDLMVDGPGSGSGNGINLDGNTIIYSFYVTMRNVMVRQFGGTGIVIDDPVTTDLYNVTSKENGAEGFWITCSDTGTVGTSTSLVTCYAHNNAANGYRFYNLVYSTLTGCASDNNVNGYKVEACEGFTLTGCGAEVNSGDSIQISGGNEISVWGAWLSESGTNAVHVTGNAHMVTLAGIKEYTSSTSSNNIKVDSGCTVMAFGNKSDSRPDSIASGTTNILTDTALAMSLAGKLGVGTAADTNAMVNIAQAADQRSVVISNTVSGGNINQPSIDVSAANAAGLLLAGRVSGDSTARVLWDMNGKLYLGPGNASRDTFLYRNGVNTLKTDGTFTVGTATVSPIVQGSTASGGSLTLKSTTHATKGKILLGTSAYDEVNNRLGVGTASPAYPLDVAGTARFTANVSVGGVDVVGVQPGDVGYKLWTFDPATVVGGGQAVVAGTIYLSAVYVRSATTVSTIYLTMANSQAVTSGQCWAGIYDSTGAKLVDVDTSGSVGTLGPKSFTVSTQSLSSGLYWTAQVYNFSSTAPQVMAGNTTGNTRTTSNGAIVSAAQYRFATNGTGTTLPSSITPASNSTTGLLTLWAALG